MFSDDPADKTMRRIIGGGALIGVAALGLSHLRNTGNQPPPPPPALQGNSSALLIAAGEHKARMEAAMQGMSAEEKCDYLYEETAKAASVRARGITEGESADLYYDFVPRSIAIAELAGKLPKTPQEQLQARVGARRKLMEEAPTDFSPKFSEQLLGTFALTYDDPTQGAAAIEKYQANPDFMEMIQNEMAGAYADMHDRLGAGKGRGG